MLNRKTKFIFCETTICWKKMQITKQLNLNENKQKEKKIKQRLTPMLNYVTNSIVRRNNAMSSNNSWHIIQ